MADLVLAICTILGASVYLRAAFTLPQLGLGDAVGPRLFPQLIGIGLAIGGLMLLWETWRKRTEAGVAAGAVAGPDATSPVRSAAPLMLLGLVFWTLLYYAAFEPLGYVLATITYATGALCYFHRTHWYWNVLTAVGFTLTAWLTFSQGLGVVLPAGLLGGWGAG